MKTIREIKVQNFLTDEAESKIIDTESKLKEKGYLGLIDELERFIDRESDIYQNASFFNEGLVEEFSKNMIRKCNHLLNIK